MSLSPYAFAHLLRDKFPFIWETIERGNAYFFRLRYARRLKHVEPDAYRMAEPFLMEPIASIPTAQLVDFFHDQPADTYRWFTPHGFELADVAKLQHSQAFVAYVLKREEQILGYFFLRCFCNGTCYFGRIVDFRYRNQGIGTLIGKVSFYLSESLHMQSYQTVAKDNIASAKSSTRAYHMQVIGTTANGDILYKNSKL
jgi:hypothetical protein